MTTCRKCAEGTPHSFEHGTVSGYGYHQCPCDLCVDAWNDYQHKWLAARPGYKARQQALWRARNLERRRKWDREYARKYRSDPVNRARVRQIQRESHQRNREARNAKNRELHSRRQYKTPDQVREESARYRKTQKYRDQAARRASIPGPRNREPWTAEDDAVVIRDDISVREMCFLLGRTYNQVETRRRKVRYGYRSRPLRPFMEHRLCEYCGTEYLAGTNRARFCGDLCKGRFYHRENPERRREYERKRRPRKR